jgi:trehalose synthase
VDAVVTPPTEFGPPSVPAMGRHLRAVPADPPPAEVADLDPAEVSDLLAEAGLTSHQDGGGSVALVEQHCPIPAGARVVLGVSTWDRLADLPGVLRCLPGLPADVHLVLAGRDPDSDPGSHPDNGPGGTAAAAVLDQLRAVRASMSIVDRLRVHLVLTSACDPRRAELLLTALRRRADVVLPASLAASFGRTGSEVTAQRRAVVAASAGGSSQQLAPGDARLLAALADPADRCAALAALRILLDDPRLRRAQAAAAAAPRWTWC